MRRYTYTLLFFGLLAMVACRRDKYDPTITQYDEDQIKAYMSANGLSGFTRDTSGIYYKILDPGRDTSTLQYTSNTSMVFTIRSVDNKYVSTDSINNHYDGYVGHIATTTTPLGLDVVGLQEAVHNLMKHNGAIARVLVPSRLGYGVSGAGVGSSSNTAGRIAGNQSLDYYVHLVAGNDTVTQEAYDQLVIKNYIANNSLTMTQDPVDHYWYTIREPGFGNSVITDNSSIVATFTMTLLNGTIASQANNDGGTGFDLPDMIKGVQKGLKKYGKTGGLLTFIFPSRLAYGKSQASIPPNSVVKFEIRILGITP